MGSRDMTIFLATAIMSLSTTETHTHTHCLSTAYVSFRAIDSFKTLKNFTPHTNTHTVIRSEAACESVCVLACLAERPTVSGSVAAYCLAKQKIGINL